MKWEKLLSPTRLGEEKSTPTTPEIRTPFEADVDRIIFSSAFRRLNRKTQVHPLAANDHVHTRMTHSLEVARVGKNLGKALGFRIEDKLPKGISPHDLGSIVEAACLAHDIGNPPFGHAGEEAIAHWFENNGSRFFGSLSKDHKRDLMIFEGNAQGFRMITQTENRLFEGGLRLTYATLGTFLKYPRTSRGPERKFGAYLTEEPILERIATELGLVSKSKHTWSRHPLAHLVEAADDICYAIIDLEDAVELKILSFDQVEEILLSPFAESERTSIRSTYGPKAAHRVNLARLRGPVFELMISGTIEAFIKGYDSIMRGELDHTLFELLGDDDPRKAFIAAAKDRARTDIFMDQKKVETELGSYATFECLLDAFCQAAVDAAQHFKSPKGEATLAWKSQHVLQLLGDHAPSEKNVPPGATWSTYQCLRRVIDFVSGMTDNYATYVAKQLQGAAFAGVQRP
ncbi:deoxyguanosinetriphosphate triphosphohydrolase [Nitrospira sp. NS4]|uniref:deoxyguanosinetriphosphate triphosphohydrolase n=1 Tax=Nitrospira sp. NS4 TaxID=3414498 RepID=UPI003C2F47D6